MMKIILTSNGLKTKKIIKETQNLLKKPLKENKTIVLFGARTKVEMGYVKEVIKELIKLGIPRKNIDLINFSKKIKIKNQKYDFVYVCGGNTYYILKKLKENKLLPLIKKLVEEGSVYCGVSAGSIIAGKDIEIAGWGEEGDPNEVNLKDLEGLGFTNIAIFPHYRKGLKKDVESFKKRFSYPVETLKDNEAIIIKDIIKKIK